MVPEYKDGDEKPPLTLAEIVESLNLDEGVSGDKKPVDLMSDDDSLIDIDLLAEPEVHFGEDMDQANSLHDDDLNEDYEKKVPLQDDDFNADDEKKVPIVIEDDPMEGTSGTCTKNPKRKMSEQTSAAFSRLHNELKKQKCK
jgi:hypothetical protein